MQMVKKVSLSLVVFWFAIILFMPKQQMYYALENQLWEEGIAVNEATFSEGLFTLTIENAELYVKGIHVANIKEMDLFTLLFYSSISVKELEPDASLKSMLPVTVGNLKISHSIISPLRANISALGSFGEAKGEIDLNARNMRVNFLSEESISSLKRQLKHDDEGWYYETSF